MRPNYWREDVGGYLALLCFWGIAWATAEYFVAGVFHPAGSLGWTFYAGSPYFIYGTRGGWQLWAHKAFAYGWAYPACGVAAFIPVCGCYWGIKALRLSAARAAAALAIGFGAAFVFGLASLVMIPAYRTFPRISTATALPLVMAGLTLAPAAGVYALLGTKSLRTLVRWRYLPATALVVFLVAAALSFWPGVDRRPIPRAPNVLYITMDAFRSDRLGLAPDGKSLTPHLDKLTAEGVVFRHAISPAPWTAPSFATVFTGFNPAVTGAREQAPLATSFVTFTELFEEAGYDTAAIAGNHHLEPRHGIAQGFRYYRTMSLTNATYYSRLYYTAVMATFAASKEPYRNSTPKLEKWAARYLRSREGKRRPFFLWIHYYDPHGPYSPPARFVAPADAARARGVNMDAATPEERKAVEALYNGEVRMVDESVGRLMALTERLGFDRNTIVVISADHGEEFWEHDDNYGHGRSLYEPGLRVPLIIHADCVRSMRGVVDATVTTQDLLATVALWCGVGVPEDNQARSFDAVLKGSPARDGYRKLFFSSAPFAGDASQVSVTDGRYKLIWSGETDSWCMFDLTADPGEATPIRNPFLAAPLLNGIREWSEDNERRAADFGPRAFGDEMVRRDMSSLGYIK